MSAVTATAALEVLVPGPPGAVLAADDDEALLALFDDPPVRAATGAHVRGIMIASLDGAATGPDGRSGSLGDAADHRVFGALRALADVVLVGAGTVRAEGYADVQVPDRLRAARSRRGRAERVVLAVVTGSGALPDEILDGDALVVTASGAQALPALRDRVGGDRLVLADPVGPERDDADGPPRVDAAAVDPDAASSVAGADEAETPARRSTTNNVSAATVIPSAAAAHPPCSTTSGTFPTLMRA